MISLLRHNAPLRHLFFAEIISLLGDWLTYVAVSVLALQEGHGLLAVALVLVAHTLPNALASPLSGFIADRFDRRSLVVAACIARGVLTVVMACVAHARILALVQLFLMMRTAGDAFYEPAAQAILARIVKSEDLVAANSLFATAWSVMFTAGVALGGFLASLAGPVTCIALDALTFFAAAMLLARLPRVRPEGRGPLESNPHPPFRPGAIVTELVQAWRYAEKRPSLARAVLGKTPTGFAGGGAWVALTMHAHQNPWLATTSATLGLLHSIRAAGTGLGPIAWTRTVRPRFPDAPMETGTLVLMAGVVLLAVSSSPTLVVMASLLWGVGGSINWVLTTSGIQREAEDMVRGRLAATDQLGFFLGTCMGALLAAIIGQAAGIVWGTLATVAVAGAIVVLTRMRFR